MIDLKYSYLLLFVVPTLIPLIIIFVMRKDLRRVILVKGLMGGVVGLVADWLLIGRYWEPYTIFGRGIVSVEAFLCGFCTVALAAVCYLFVSNRRDRIMKLYENSGFVVRMFLAFVIVLMVGAAIMFAVMKLTGLDVMLTTVIVAGLFTIGVFVWLRSWKLIREYLWHAFLVVVTMLAIGAVSYGLWHMIFPSYWHDVLIATNWNVMVLGFMPLSELIYWTLILGAAEIGFGEPPGRKIKKYVKP
jgi:hypothetical protein